MLPRLEVVADEDRVETVGLSRDREVEKLTGGELLGGRFVSQPEWRLHARERLSRFAAGREDARSSARREAVFTTASRTASS